MKLSVTGWRSKICEPRELNNFRKLGCCLSFSAMQSAFRIAARRAVLPRAAAPSAYVRCVWTSFRR